MSQIAEKTGIGRATLYKYFPDVQTILLAWHDEQIGRHLDHLVRIRDQPGTAGERLEAVLAAYTHIAFGRQRHGSGRLGNEIAAFVHRDEHLAPAQQQVTGVIQELLSEAVSTGEVRDDVPADELANYCVHALDAARTLPSE